MNHNNVPMTEILPYLYLGNRSDANNVTSLTKNGIGFILNLTTSATAYPTESRIISRHINILDSVYQCLKETYQNAFDFIDEAQKCNSKVLIHCEAGISRSPTITVAYLIYKKKMEALEAYNFVKKLRPIVSPNFGFMGQLMELENELLPEKVKLRLEKEAILQKEATKLKEERLKAAEEQIKQEVQNQKPLVEKVIENNINKVQLNSNKPIKIAIKPTSLNIQIIHKKPISLPKPLLIDLQSPVLSATNKYVLPTNENTNLDQILPNQDLENRNQANLNSNINSINNQQIQPKTITNSPKCNLQTNSQSLNSSNSPLNNKQLVNSSSSSFKIKEKDCLQQDNHLMPKSTSQPQLTNCINKIDKSQLSIRDPNNNVNILNNEQIKHKSISVDLFVNGNGVNKLINDKSEVKLINKTIIKKEDKLTDKLIDKIIHKSTNLIKNDKLADKPTNLIKNDKSEDILTRASIKQNQNTTASLPNSNASTPPLLSTSRQQTLTQALCLSELLNPNSKSISQNNIFLINSSKHNSGLNSNNLTTTINSSTNVKSQMKPLRPSTLLLNSNVPRKIKHNAITPSSLCSPLTAFAVSSTKSSPTFNHHISSNLSSPFELSEKLVKRRWEKEATSYQDLTKDFNPPDCKKKNKQKKLKNITVEVK